MPDVSQVEWLNQNALRNYPFREDAQRRPHLQDGTVVPRLALPVYAITDFAMTVSADESTDIHLMQLAVVGDSVTLVFGHGTDTAATVHVDASEHETNKAYWFSGIGDYDDAKGCVVVGDLDRLRKDIPDGLYSYTYDETAFETRCIRPTAKRVSSLSIYDPNTGYTTGRLRGDVKLVAGRNISLRYDAERNAIWISADSNSGYNDECDCGGSTTVKTINGISVENVAIVGDECVTVTTKGNSIVISDKCSKPCCGCAELDFINEKISQINTALRKLDAYAEVLDRRIGEAQASFVQADTGASGS